MPRGGKVQIKRIEDRAVKNTTFSRRRKGLFKKANELSVMCDAQVGVVVFSEASNLTHFGNPSVDEVIDRWSTHSDRTQPQQQNPPLNDLNVDEEEEVKREYERLSKICAEKELIVSQMQGKELGSLSMEQLNLLEERMKNIYKIVNAKEREKYEKKISDLQHKIDLMEVEQKGQQKQQLGVENVVHQESESERASLPESVGTTNNENSEVDMESLLCLRLGR